MTIGETTLVIEAKAKGVDETRKKISDLNKEGEKSIKVSDRMKTSWDDVSAAIAGLDYSYGLTIGSSSKAMQQLRQMYQIANTEMETLASSFKNTEEIIQKTERKVTISAARFKKSIKYMSAFRRDLSRSTSYAERSLVKLAGNKVELRDINPEHLAKKHFFNDFPPGPLDLYSIGKNLVNANSNKNKFRSEAAKDFIPDILVLKKQLLAYRKSQDNNSTRRSQRKTFENNIEAHSKNMQQMVNLFKQLTKGILVDGDSPYEDYFQLNKLQKLERERKYNPNYGVGVRKTTPGQRKYVEDLVREIINLFEANEPVKQKLQGIGREDLSQLLQGHEDDFMGRLLLAKKMKLTDVDFDKLINMVKRSQKMREESIKLEKQETQAIQKQVQINQDGTTKIQDSWNKVFNEIDFGYRDPLQGFQEDVSNLSIDLQGVGDAAQDSSKDFVKANKDAQKSQDELSKAVTDGTQDALTGSFDHYTKFTYDLMNLYHDGHDSFVDLKDQETQIVDDQTGEQIRIVKQATQEQARIQESGTVTMLKSWADMTQGWDQIAMDALEGIQQTLYDSFRNAFEGVGNLWDNLWDGMKNIAYQVLASIATRMATGLIANIGLNFIGGASGAGGAAGMAGSAMNAASTASSAYNWLGSGGAGGFGTYGGVGSSLFSWQSAPTAANFVGPGAPMTTGLSGLGYGVAGIGGAFTGYNLSYELYGKNNGAQVGGTLGGAGGAMLGAKIGTLAYPGIGTLIGALLGALAGGVFGGGIGSAFGGGEPDIEDREADAERSYKIMKELNEQANLDQDVDVDKYLEAINAGHRSDNRVDPEAMWALYTNLKSKDKLPWWAGDPGQIAHTRNLGATEWGQPDWMRFRLFGNNLPGETGDSGMAQWFGGGGEGPWGGEGNWDRVKGALGETDDETLNQLGDSLFKVKDGAAAFGVDLAELMGEFDLSQLESGEWAAILRDELTPASLMAAMNDKLRAEGMNNLEIAAQKQAAAIDSLLGTFNMSEEDTDAWVDQLFKANAEQEDLAKKMEEYQKIVEELKTLRAGEEDKAKDLIERGRELREELGLGESAFAKIEEGFEKFVEAMEKIAERLLNAAGDNGDDIPTEHDGGYIYHRGGMVGAMLQAGLITPHGGMTHMHTGGLRPDERMAILQAGEFVIKRSSVNPDTLAMLRSINATGRLPFEMMGRAMDRLQEPPRFHSGGPVIPLAASSPAPQPKGGDGGVTINMTPGAITINPQPGQDSGEIAREVQAKFLAWLQTPQGQAQVKQAADKAPGRNFV